MIPLLIEYPGTSVGVDPHDELLDAEHVMGQTYRLLAHAVYLPLAPGDLVDAEAGAITSLRLPSKDWVVEVFLNHALTNEEGWALIEEWRRAVRLTTSSALTCRLSSSTRQWVDEILMPDGRVDYITLLRSPGQTFDFQAERAKQ